MHPPLFITEFVLDINSITFSPNLDMFQDKIGTIIDEFQRTVLEVKNLVPDQYFDAFTRSVMFLDFTNIF